MVLALLFSLTVVSAGFATLRAFGLARGAVALGLAPPAGLAVLGIASSWCMLLGAPPPLPGLVTSALLLLGVALAIHERQTLTVSARIFVRHDPLAAAILGSAVLVPIVTMGVAFADVHVPLSPHDGSAHSEAIQALRFGQPWTDWYPPGMAAIFAAWLQVFPWVDSAEGAFDLGRSLPTLASLAMFGLGVAVWRDTRRAALSALLLSFTYLYPYFPQFWSGWPLAVSVILLIGVWTIGLEYLRRATAGWSVLAGLLLGAVVLVHGSELYSLAIVLPIVLMAGVARVVWRKLPVHLGLAAVVAAASAAPYLPVLFHWAAAGGAYAVGLEDVLVPGNNARGSDGPDLFTVFGLEALGIDLPIRLVALAVGIGWVFRNGSGRSVVAVGVAFLAITTVVSLLINDPIVRHVYAATFPWGMQYRTLILVVIAQSLLAAAGSIAVLGWIRRWASCRTGRKARLVKRATNVLVLTWFAATVWATGLFLAYPASLVLGYTNDDQAAMDWLRRNASAAELVANDSYADAGIWTLYKAGHEIVWPRAVPANEVSMRLLVVDNVGRLDQVPEATAAACAMRVGYVYLGARVSGWDVRRFPSRDELRASSALEEVFSSGEAAVFRVRLPCSGSPIQ